MSELANLINEIEVEGNTSKEFRNLKSEYDSLLDKEREAREYHGDDTEGRPIFAWCGEDFTIQLGPSKSETIPAGWYEIIKTYDRNDHRGYHCQLAIERSSKLTPWWYPMIWVEESNVHFRETPVRTRTLVDNNNNISVVWMDPRFHACILKNQKKQAEAPNQEARQSLQENGVVILRSCIPDTLCWQIKHHSNSLRGFKPIFGTDKSRSQYNLTKDQHRPQEYSVFSQFNEKLPISRYALLHTYVSNAVHELISPYMLPKQGVLLKSKMGNTRQYVHCDYDLTCKKNNSLSNSNFGIIVALEDNTRFVCWPKKHSCEFAKAPVRSKDSRCPTMKKGDVLIFLDSLPHAGSDYKQHSNTRVHFYCDNALHASECRGKFTKEDCLHGCSWINMSMGNGRNENKCLMRKPNYTQYKNESFEYEEKTAIANGGERNPEKKKVYEEFLKAWSYEDKREEPYAEDLSSIGQIDASRMFST